MTRAKATAAVGILAALLTVSIVSPAVGGPSITSIARTAKKALRTAKTANRRAGSALSSASAAKTAAANAQNTANAAAAHGAITVVDSGQVPYGADVVQSAAAFCPAGQLAVSGGGVNVADEQLAATLPTAGRSGWFVIGVDLVDNGGEYIEAQALCAPAGQAVAATSHAAALRQVERRAASIGAGRQRR